VLRVIAYIGVLLLSVTGAALSVAAYSIFSTKDDYTDNHAATIFGVFCGISGLSLVMTAVAVARSLE
jgi:uncharacterized membrane protein